MKAKHDSRIKMIFKVILFIFIILPQPKPITMLKTILFTIFIIGFSLSGKAQAIKGRILDQNSQPVPFVKVRINNTSQGTITNGKGEYTLEVRRLGNISLKIYGPGFNDTDTTINLSSDLLEIDFTLQELIQELEEIRVTATNKKERGKAFMKQVIARRSDFLKSTERYSAEIYCFASLDRQTNSAAEAELDTSDNLEKKKVNLTEWVSRSFYEAKDKYKDEFIAFTDYTEKSMSSASVEVNFDMGEELGGITEKVESNPYIFVNNSREADINIFLNQISLPKLCHKPLVSPLAFNALMHYNFYLERSFFEGSQQIFEIRVEPKFKEEPLFYGTIYIKDKSFEPASYELGINPGAMPMFKEVHLLCSYQKMNKHIVPNEREFIYLLKDRGDFVHGKIVMQYRDYEFDFDDSKKNFWTQTMTYAPESYDRDTSYWTNRRPFHLKDSEKSFIHEQDSISSYHESEVFKKKLDSSYNSITFWDALFNGVGHRNSFKGYTIHVGGLINQVVPLGVGGYRHRLDVSYDKEFKNAQALSVNPLVDYGFRNKDLKGALRASFKYNPLKFSKVRFRVGDVYDFVNNYESIQGTIAPANRVRNQTVSVGHSHEIRNGLYFSIDLLYSRRSDIGEVEYPEWASLFGQFADVAPFETYNIFFSEIQLAYRPGQEYLIQKNKKIVIGTKWPMFRATFKKGYPQIFQGQADFDFVQLSIDDDIDLKQWGNAEFKLESGSFIRKKDLRVIENKYFRTSDRIFFSNPIRSMQMLDTALNTQNSFLQTNFIHHFRGAFLNKIPLINKLGLEETIGGGALLIPDANFQQVEFYIGLDRTFRIRRQLFKIGFYAVAADNNFGAANIRYKFGINFYDSFRDKWTY